MKKVVIASLILLAPAAALGADLPGKSPAVVYSPTSAEPASNWSGFYVGVNAGAALGNVNASALSPLTNADLSAMSGKMHRSGPLGGLQGGYQIQTGAVVYGLEADIDFGSMRGSYDAVGVISGIPVSARLDSKIGTLGTVRARVGFATDTVLIYGTGGFATAYHEGKAVAAVNGVPAASGAITEWVPGWTLGVGGEYAVSRNVSVKLEYLYAQLSNKVLNQSVTHSMNLIRTGVNYRF